MAISLSLPVKAMGKSYYYVVKKNDHASDILFRASLKPIYGKIGTLDALKNFNKDNIPNLDKIKPGDKIYFPEALALEAKAHDAIELTSHLEIVFKLAASARAPAGEACNSKPELEKSPPQSKIVESSRPVLDQKSLPNLDQMPAQSEISVALEAGFSRIDSNQNSGNATLLSKPHQGLSLNWTQLWSDDWQSSIQWKTSSVTFADSSQGSALGGEKQTTSSFSIGAKYQLSPKTSTAFEMGVREEIFAPSYSAGTATLETKPINFLKFSISKDIAQVRRLLLSGYAGASYLLGQSGSNYDVKAGYDYFGGVRIKHELKSFSIFASGEYDQSAQDSSLSNQSRKDIKTQIGLSIPFGAEESP